MTAIQTLGFVGLGVMGLPICRNITARIADDPEMRMLCFDQRPEAREAAAAFGATACASATEVGRGADLVFMCLPGEPELRAALFAWGGLAQAMREGSTLVDLSTAPVDFSREVASVVAERGIAFADAPIARTRQAAEDGTLSITVGGADEVFARIEPILRYAATDVTHCGPVGCGQVVKLMNNMVLVQTVIALAEARAIARRAGVPTDVLFDALSKGSADSFALRNHGMKAMLPDAFPQRAFSTEYALKDIGYALRLAEQEGVTAQGAMLAHRVLETSRDAGNGTLYWPALARVVDAPEKPET
jgi:3-hydroxyisobutyrate dehydrogenase-like beta-hydroxyacid dehydrogenase